jgi:hypothetical protein
MFEPLFTAYDKVVHPKHVEHTYLLRQPCDGSTFDIFIAMVASTLTADDVTLNYFFLGEPGCFQSMVDDLLVRVK